MTLYFFLQTFVVLKFASSPCNFFLCCHRKSLLNHPNSNWFIHAHTPFHNTPTVQKVRPSCDSWKFYLAAGVQRDTFFSPQDKTTNLLLYDLIPPTAQVQGDCTHPLEHNIDLNWLILMIMYRYVFCNFTVYSPNCSSAPSPLD